MIATSHKRSWISYAGSLPASEGPRKGVDRGRRQNGWPPLSGWVSSRPLDLQPPLLPSPPLALVARPLSPTMAAPPKRTISITHPHSNYCEHALVLV